MGGAVGVLLAPLEGFEGVLPVPEGAEDVLLLGRDDGDRVRDEEGRLLLGDAPHVAAGGGGGKGGGVEEGNREEGRGHRRLWGCQTRMLVCSVERDPLSVKNNSPAKRKLHVASSRTKHKTESAGFRVKLLSPRGTHLVRPDR